MTSKKMATGCLTWLLLLPSLIFMSFAVEAKGNAPADTLSLRGDSVRTASSSIDSIKSKTFPKFTGKRRAKPIDNAATATQARNEVKNDTVRINREKRLRSTHYQDSEGNLVFVDTVTGEEWTNSTLIPFVPKMKQPLLFSASAGVNIWDGVMRIFGQKYGIGSIWGEINLHNRYIPRFEIGVGATNYTPDTGKYHYRCSTSPYFKIGAAYNFLFNSNPAYQFRAGLNYGFSPFNFTVTNITVDSPYWDESVEFNIPKQSVTAGWIEATAGVRVKLFGRMSAGWDFIFHRVLHGGKTKYGEAWYIPGFGSRKSSITGAFSVSYTLPLNHKPAAAVNTTEAGTSPTTTSSSTPAPQPK